MLAQLATAKPVFTQEGPQFYQQAFARNRPFALPGPYETALPGGGMQEQQFRQWLTANRVPFDPNAATSDYDMRGFFASGQAGRWRPGDHFPDTFKTPYDTSFSAESKYAAPNNPLRWNGQQLVDSRTGRVVFGQAR